MRKAQRFIFTKYFYDVKNSCVSFYYRVEFEDSESEVFEEKLILPSPCEKSDSVLNSILQSLHLAFGVSYYKLWCPREIVIENNFLSQDAAQFWNSVYTKGLGEFFYQNKIDFHDLIKFPYLEKSESPKKSEEISAFILSKQHTQPSRLKMSLGQAKSDNKTQILIGIGGGKDSIVAAEVLKKAGLQFGTCYLADPIREKVASQIGAPSLSIERQLDPKMLTLTKTSEVYNGHVPVSSIYAFAGLLLCHLYSYKYLVVGNERSSNYGSVEYLGQMINHQWSKSAEFERLFQSYVKSNISVDLNYFSLMRPFYEIEIVRRFCQFPEYFSLFSSCNRNFKIEDAQKDKLWCGVCPKCAFVFCLMSAFLPKEKLITIFGENLYDKESLLDTYRELLGVKDIKPFDCVGTPEEVKVALSMAQEKGDYNQDVIMKMFEAEVLPNLGGIESMKSEVFSFGDDSNIPEQFRKVLKTPLP